MRILLHSQFLSPALYLLLLVIPLGLVIAEFERDFPKVEIQLKPSLNDESAGPQVIGDYELTIDLLGANSSEGLKSCLSTGIEIRYSLELELCRSRRFWPDDCLDVATVFSDAELDAVSNSYKVYREISTRKEYEFYSMINQEEALSFVSNFPFTKLAVLFPEIPEKFKPGARTYVLANFRAFCKRRPVFSLVPYYLSFGLIEPHVYESEEVKLFLKSKEN